MGDDTDNWNTYLETPPSSFGHSALDSFTFSSTDSFGSPQVSVESNLIPPSMMPIMDSKGEVPIVYPEIDVNFEVCGEMENRTLNISNIAQEITQYELQNVLKRYGPIDKIQMFPEKNLAQVSYYDIRSARWLRIEQIFLKDKPLLISFAPLNTILDMKKPPNNGTIVIFHLPADATNQVMEDIFSKFGEIRQIRKTPSKKFQRFIEFFDLRSAENALNAMNGQIILTSRVSIEFSLPGGYRKNAMQVAPVPTIQRVRTHQWV